MPLTQWKALFLLGVGVTAIAYVSAKAAMAVLATLVVITAITHAKTLANFIGTFQ